MFSMSIVIHYFLNLCHMKKISQLISHMTKEQNGFPNTKAASATTLRYN